MKTLIAIVFLGILSNTAVADTDPAPVTVIKTDIPCYDTDTLFNTLKKEYKEIPIVYGTANDQAESIMSVWTSPSSKSWTIVATKDDTSCVIGAGNKFKFLPLKVGKPI